MIGNVSIDLSLTNIWRCWYLFIKGKRKTKEIENFVYYLENNLYVLYKDLNCNGYYHKGYTKFRVYDSKQRTISVANIRDRIVHRLIYEYLVPIYNKTFDFDVWSCRKGKGLSDAIKRVQSLLKKNDSSFVWRADIRKFFDNIDQDILKKIIARKIECANALTIVYEIIDSYQVSNPNSDCFKAGVGIPIGNLTSQIFANIYFDKFDRYIRNYIKPKAYVRYGDDFIIIEKNLSKLEQYRALSRVFLAETLKVCIKDNNEVIIKTRHGLKFLGTVIYPYGKKLNKRNISRINHRLSCKNISSYAGLAKKIGSYKIIKYINWEILKEIKNE